MPNTSFSYVVLNLGALLLCLRCMLSSRCRSVVLKGFVLVLYIRSARVPNRDLGLLPRFLVTVIIYLYNIIIIIP